MIEAFVRLPQVEAVEEVGSTWATVRLRSGLRADLRAVVPDQWGVAWQHFTGSQAHNARLRELASGLGLHLNEDGFRRQDGTDIPCAHEKAVYAELGLPWIPPELRENRGEIEAASAGRLPSTVELRAVRGDLHVHTVWSDGRMTVEEMVLAARARGYEYIAITDHSTGLGVVNGLDPERLRQQREEIQAINARYDDITVLQGAEVEIRSDGTLAYPDDVLASLDIVVASLHTGLRQPRKQITARLVAAIRHPLVHIIGHPTGRLLLRRPGADLDMEAVLRAAAETGTALEINASPQRLDLDDHHVRRAVELGCHLVINSDAHRTEELANMCYGVWQARRGWAETHHILNTRPLGALLAALKGRR
ncbi:MAG: DNA polymerase/3'-5' exonuclease PolX [Ardenticatenia bacterium]|nr:DNA polymerase/3'-5' exonuclease PolX [Ardenticatenia bacterium]